MKILKTNWINFIGVLMAVWMYIFISNFTSKDYVMQSFSQSMVAAMILLFVYGILFWIGFIILLILFDLILNVSNKKKLKLKLLIEWMIIASPVIYFAVLYERQRGIYVVAVVTFLITQVIRERMIKRKICNVKQVVNIL